MWCTEDGVDVETGDDVHLRKVPPYGWVHSSDDGSTWHTLKGSPVVGIVPGTPGLPAVDVPVLASVIFHGEMQVPLGGAAISLEVPDLPGFR